MNITIIFAYVHRAEVYKNIELLISMSKDEKRRNIGKNISCNTPKIRSGKSYARLSQDKDRYGLPPVEGEMAHSAKGGVVKSPLPLGEGRISAQGTSARNSGEGKKPSLVQKSKRHSERSEESPIVKPSFMQKALKAAAMFALALGTASLSADSQAQASSNFLNIRGASDIETQVLEEQDKRRRFLTNKSGTKFTNKIVSTSILRINPEVLNAVQNSIGQRDGVMRDLALRASEATLAESNPYLYGSTVVEDEASVRNSREGNVSDPLLSTSLTSSPEGGRGVVVGINSIETIEVESNMSLRGVDEVNDAAIHNSYGNQTQTAGLLHSVRNDMSGIAQESISPWGEKNFDASEASVRNLREGNVLAPNGDDTLTQNSNAHKFALNFHPLPEVEGRDVIASEILPPVEGEMGDSPKGVNNTQPPTPTMSVLPPASMGQRLVWHRGQVTGYATPIERQVVNSGETVDKIEGSFNNHSYTNVPGGFIYNAGTIKNAILEVVGNTETWTSSNDDGFIIFNTGTIDNLNINLINNHATQNNTSGSPTAAIFYYGVGKDGSINGTFTNNSLTSNTNYSGGWGVDGGAIFVGEGSSVGSIDAIFNGNYAVGTGSAAVSGGAIYLGNFNTAATTSINSVTGKFINNYVQSNTGVARGGAIANLNGTGTSTIGSIGTSSNPATFIGNYAKSTSGSAQGGAIYNAGTIGDIYGNFTNNYAKSTSGDVKGGAIYNAGTITSIIGNFANNKVLSSGEGVYWGALGSAICNEGTITTITNSLFMNNLSDNKRATGALVNHEGTINTISNSIFANNKAQNTSGHTTDWAEGGAIHNYDGRIETIKNVIFVNNTVDLNGGALYNQGPNGIGNVDALFIGNSAVGRGGAISNNSSISSITGDFINNSATSTSGAALGGGIYNSGTITKVVGNFIGNTTTSGKTTVGDGLNAQGAGIYNSGTITVIGDFVGNINNNTANNINSADGGGIYNTGTMTVTGNFYNNSTNAGGGAIYNHGTLNIIADSNHDILFYNNVSTVGDSYRAKYFDISNYNVYGTATTNLNANRGKRISFGGYYLQVPNSGSVVTNINNGSSNTGGEYIFNSPLESGTINLYNGADVRFGNVRQADGSVSLGKLDVSATTNDANGGYLNFANYNTTDFQKFGALTLGSDLKVGIDFDLGTPNQDGLQASNVTANGHKVLIDYINAYNPSPSETIGTSYTYPSNWLSDNLKPVIALSDTLKINSAYEWDGYSASYDSASGNLTLTKVGTGTENLVGFLHNDDGSSSLSGLRGNNVTLNSFQGLTNEEILNQVQNDSRVAGMTDEQIIQAANNGDLDTMTYALERDEQALTSIGTMAGTNKTIEGNGYNIIGNQNAGVELSDGQTLTINNANVEGFYREDGGFVNSVSGSNIDVNGTNFRNNNASVSGGAIYNAGTANISDSSFITNIATGTNGGGAVFNAGTMVVSGSSFDGNTFQTIQGGSDGAALYNAKDITISDSSFTNNSAGWGGAFYNHQTDAIASITDSTFKYNSAKSNGGAIYNAGTIANADTTDRAQYSITQHVVTNAADTATTLTYYDASDVTAINQLIAQGKKVQLLTNMVETTVSESDFTALQEAIAADTSYETYAPKNPKLLVDISDYWLPNDGGISNTTFDGNYITTSGSTDIKGGAVYSTESGVMNFEGKNTFSNNTLTSIGEANAYGAGLYNEGTIGDLNADFTGNKIIVSDGRGYGAGLFNEGVIGVIKGTFDSNQIVGTAVHDFQTAYGSAGAALLNSGVIGTILSDFTNNSINAPNDGWHTINGTTIFNNGTIGSIGSENRYSLISGNSATSYRNINATVLNYGEISSIYANIRDNTMYARITSGVGLSNAGNIEFIKGLFENNVGNNYANTSWGGALFNSAGNITSLQADFIENKLISQGGASSQGGAIYNNVDATITSIGSAENPVLFQGNSASAVSGNARGGAIYNTGTIGDIHADFIGNSVSSASGEAHGGAIYNSGNIKITDSSFVNNTATSTGSVGVSAQGGAIYNTADGKAKIVADSKDILFKNNIATNSVNPTSTDGGAIVNSGGIINIFGENGHRILFEGNSAGDDGGTIHNEAGEIVISNADFRNSTGNYSVLFQRDKATLIDTNFIGNTTTSTSALANYSSATLTNIVAKDSDVIFKNNKLGSAYYDYDGTGVLNLNASSGHSISFGGAIAAYHATNAGTMNLGKSGNTYTALNDDFSTSTVRC